MSRKVILPVVLLNALILIITMPIYYAHFGIVIPDKYMANIGEKVTVYAFYGHAFEHEVFPEFSVAAAKVYTPDGEVFDLELVKVNSTHYKGTLTCEVDGDYIIYIIVKAIHEGAEFVDYAKAVIHCGVEEKNWYFKVNAPLELVLYTRPYGLEVPSTVCGVVYVNGTPKPNVRVEYEYYYPVKPEELLEKLEEEFVYPDALITKAIVTDRDGEFCAELNIPGHWAISPVIETEKKTVRSTIMVYVFKKVTEMPSPTPPEGISGKIEELSSRIEDLSTRISSLESEVLEVKSRLEVISIPDWLSGLAIGAIVLAIIAIIISGISIARARRR